MGLVALRKLRERVAARPGELEAARRQGAKVVGWLGYGVPEEVLHALGLIPVRLGTGGDDRLIEIGSRYISTKNCVYTRSVVGIFAERTDPYVRAADLVAVDTTCLHLYRAAEIIQHYFKVQTAVLGVPRNFYLPESHEYFEGELLAFTSKLEAFAGHPLDPSALAASVQLFAGIRKATQELYALQSDDDAPITWREVFEVVHAGFYLDREEYLRLLQALIAEVRERGRASEPVPSKPRLFLSGSIIPPGDTKLIDIIDRVGGRIVGDDLWSGLASHLGVRVEEPTLRGIARAYIGRLPHGALPYLEQATDRRLVNLRRSVKDFDAQGVVYHTLRYCDPFTFKTGETKDVLKEDSVPLLDIHTEYAGSDYEAIRTRAEAFVEMIKHDAAAEVTPA